MNFSRTSRAGEARALASSTSEAIIISLKKVSTNSSIFKGGWLFAGVCSWGETSPWLDEPHEAVDMPWLLPIHQMQQMKKMPTLVWSLGSFFPWTSKTPSAPFANANEKHSENSFCGPSVPDLESKGDAFGEDVSTDAVVRSLDDGRGTVWKLHSTTVNGRAIDHNKSLCHCPNFYRCITKQY